MAKIGTAHIEIKPILSDGALDVIARQIEDAVRAGVQAGLCATSAGTRCPRCGTSWTAPVDGCPECCGCGVGEGCSAVDCTGTP